MRVGYPFRKSVRQIWDGLYWLHFVSGWILPVGILFSNWCPVSARWLQLGRADALPDKYQVQVQPAHWLWVYQNLKGRKCFAPDARPPAENRSRCQISHQSA